MVNNVRDLRSVLVDGTLLFYAFSENAYNEQIHNAKYRCRATSTMGTLVSKLITVKAGISAWQIILSLRTLTSSNCIDGFHMKSAKSHLCKFWSDTCNGILTLSYKDSSHLIK